MDRRARYALTFGLRHGYLPESRFGRLPRGRLGRVHSPSHRAISNDPTDAGISDRLRLVHPRCNSLRVWTDREGYEDRSRRGAPSKRMPSGDTRILRTITLGRHGSAPAGSASSNTSSCMTVAGACGSIRVVLPTGVTTRSQMNTASSATR